MLKISKPWWQTDNYDVETAIPEVMYQFQGPHGIALVRAYANGTTDKGWGLVDPKDGSKAFMSKYPKGIFDSTRILAGYESGRYAFAFVMRSLNLVTIDIDGKNGGIKHASELIAGAPPTLAEVSKSGDGYHLFYSVSDSWSDAVGFGAYSDQIGVVQGVDIRAAGCVYHYPQQRWNNRPVAKLPEHIEAALAQRAARRSVGKENITKVLATLDQEEILIMHDAILQKLEQNIPAGKRNNTLFAIGTEMQTAQIPNWEKHLEDRAIELGLPVDEAQKLVGNVQRYGDNSTP